MTKEEEKEYKWLLKQKAKLDKEKRKLGYILTGIERHIKEIEEREGINNEKS